MRATLPASPFTPQRHYRPFSKLSVSRHCPLFPSSPCQASQQPRSSATSGSISADCGHEAPARTNCPQLQRLILPRCPACPDTLSQPSLQGGKLLSLQVSAPSPALPHNRGRGNRARPTPLAEPPPSILHPFPGAQRAPFPPPPPLPWLGLPPRTPWVLTASPVAGRSSPAAQHRAVSLPAARPCSEDACGCACIACAGILGGKSAKNTSEAPLPGQRGFVQIKAEQRLPGRDVGQGRWAGRCQGLTLPSVVLLPVFPSSRASPAKHADALCLPLPAFVHLEMAPWLPLTHTTG